MQLALHAYLLNLFFQTTFLAAQQAAVNFDLFFTFAALLYTALLTRKVRPLAGQARQIILNLRQLNLEAAFFCARALAENDQNQRCTGQYLRLPFAFPGSMLARRQ